MVLRKRRWRLGKCIHNGHRKRRSFLALLLQSVIHGVRHGSDQVTPYKQRMKVKKVGALLMALIGPSLVLAGAPQVYDVAGQFQAPFSDAPLPVGSIDYDGDTFHAYAAADQELGIGYMAMFPERAQENYSPGQQEQAIEIFVVGLAEWSNSTLNHVATYSCDAAQCTDYVLAKSAQGMNILTHGKVIYKNDKFYVWGIKEFSGISKVDVPRLFQSAKSSFRVF